MTAPTDRGFFEALYAADPDPWRFASSPYERAKYRASLAALPPGRFASALEVGCSVGVMTRLLARRCRRLLAIDAAEAALRHARRRTRGLAGVRVQRRTVPAEWPPGRFDLIVLSEVLYFLTPQDLALVADLVRRSLLPGGALLLVNWTGPTGTELGGDRAASALLVRLRGRLRRVRRVRRRRYRMDVLRRPG